MRKLGPFDRILAYIWARYFVLKLVTICYWVTFWCAVSLVLNGRMLVSQRELMIAGFTLILVQVCVALYFFANKERRKSLKKDEVLMRRIETLQRIPMAFGTYGIPVLFVLVLLSPWTGIIKWLGP